MIESQPGQIQAPDGRPLNLPASADEERERYPSVMDRERFRTFFDEQGYVVARGVVPKEVCAEAMQAFQAEVKPFDGPLLRVETTRAEPHNFSARGYMTNALLDVHQLSPDRFPRFTEAALRVVTDPSLREIVALLLGEAPKLVQTMYFESGRGTPLHMDTHLFDSRRTGTQVGAWVALEDVHVGAGRFCAYARSHRLGVSQEPPFDSVANAFQEYEQLALATIRAYQERKSGLSPKNVTRAMDLMLRLIHACDLECVAPALSAGDVAFWTSKTIHGSLKPTTPERARSSLNAHFIAESDDYVKYREQLVPLNLRRVNDVPVHFPEH